MKEGHCVWCYESYPLEDMYDDRTCISCQEEFDTKYAIEEIDSLKDEEDV